MKYVYLPLIVFIFTGFISTAKGQTGTITIEIFGINKIKGLMSIGVYSNETSFPDKEGEFKGAQINVTGQTMAHTFKDIPYGFYAIAIYHDSNLNNMLDTNFLGIPKEGYGFSNNVFGVFGSPPDFNDAGFKVTGDKIIKINIKY